MVLINGMKTRGSKHDVYHSRAWKTAGGLTKDKLIVNKYGKVVSRKQSEAGKKRGTEALKKWRFEKKSKDKDETKDSS